MNTSYCFNFIDNTTLNPIPPFGEYTWQQIMSTINTLGIVVKTTVSADLPYDVVNITVILGSEKQSRILDMPIEWIEFTFDGLSFESKDYKLLITFSGDFIGDYEPEQFTITYNETVGTIATATCMVINKQFTCNFIFLIVLIILTLSLIILIALLYRVAKKSRTNGNN